MSRYIFGPFELDPEARLLRRDGEPIPLAGKTLDTLVVLVENRGRLVDKEELLSRVWAGSVVEEANLTQTIFTVRKILGDSPKNHHYIATVAGRGYQFVAPVTESIARTEPAGSEPKESHWERLKPLRRNRASQLAAAGITLAMLAAGIALWRSFAVRPHFGETSKGQATFKESPLTANPDDTPVTSSAISPDGKLLAYSDPTGLYVRHVDGGETHPVPVSPDFEAQVESWFPDGIHLLVSKIEKGEGTPGLWKLSIMGGSPQMLCGGGESASLSPGGSQIVFVKHTSPGEEVWLVQSDGSGARRIIRSGEDSFSRAAWSPDGEHFAYARTKTRYYAFRRAPDTQIEVFDLARGTSTLVQDTGPRGVPRGGAAVAWLPDGSLLYSVREPQPNQQDTNLWSIALDSSRTRALRSPVRVTSGKGIAVQLSFSNDGTRLALRRHNPQPDIYVADLNARGKSLGVLRRLTLDQRLDYAMDWTPDSKSVIFYSNRDGPFHIFKQSIDATQPDLLVSGSDDLYAPRMAPGGKSVIYVVRAKPGADTDNSKIMQVPLAGGPPRLILEVPQLWDVECPRTPGARCIYVQTVAVEGQTRLKFFSFRPETGEHKELPAIEAKVDNPNFIFSHDGQYVAWQCGRPNSDQFGFRIASMNSDWMRFVAVPHWSDLYGIDWSADSKALWVCARDSRGNSKLINVGLDGSSNTVLSGPNLSLEWVISSFDGRHLAIVKNSNSSNVSLLEAF
jgi:DNA-binding winged helix-turn-helix (wHTH) protein/Tol biopolymer transport system component